MSSLLQRIPLFWKLHIAGWLLLSLSLLPVRVLVSRKDGEGVFLTEGEFGFLFFRDALGFGLCLVMRWIYKRGYFQRLSSWRLGLHLGVISMLMAVFEVWAADILFKIVDQTSANLAAPVMLLAAFWLHFFIFSTWSFLYVFLKAFFKAKENERQFAAATLQQKEAELLMLRAHLEPHFIFNALNAIMVLSHGNPAVAPVVRGLSDYLRFCLANRNKPFVPIGEELDAIEQYLRVEKARFGDDLVVKMEVDAPSSRYVPVPGVFIMPLVENALKHRAPGNHPLYLWIQVVHRRSPGDLELLENLKMRPIHEVTHAERLDIAGAETRGFGAEKATRGTKDADAGDGGELLIRVTSNSVWQDPASRTAEGPATGVGLSHLRRRLELIYAGEGRAGFSIGPQNGYVVAEVRISDPLRQFRNPSGSASSEGN